MVCEDTSNSSDVPCVNASPDNDCEYWSTMGECTKNAAFMKTACARSCGECKVVEKAARNDDDEDEDDDDVYSKDELWYRADPGAQTRKQQSAGRAGSKISTVR